MAATLRPLRNMDVKQDHCELETTSSRPHFGLSKVWTLSTDQWISGTAASRPHFGALGVCPYERLYQVGKAEASVCP